MKMLNITPKLSSYAQQLKNLMKLLNYFFRIFHYLSGSDDGNTYLQLSVLSLISQNKLKTKRITFIKGWSWTKL